MVEPVIDDLVDLSNRFFRYSQVFKTHPGPYAFLAAEQDECNEKCGAGEVEKGGTHEAVFGCLQGSVPLEEEVCRGVIDEVSQYCGPQTSAPDDQITQHGAHQ